MSDSYRQIFKSTTLVGGAQVISILFSILRNKILAVLVGPLGVGLVGIYVSVTTLVGSVTGLGIPASGVRQIAASAAKNDGHRIGTTVATLRALTWIGGLVGMCGIIAFAAPISQLTFGDRNHAWGLGIVAAVVLIEGLGARQKVVLQGMRKIRELSICQVLGAIGGTVAAIPLIFILRERGVAGFLVVAAACSALAAWWYARRIEVERVALTWSTFSAEFRGLMNIGVATVITGFVSAAGMYLVRLLVAKKLSLDAVGLCQATWTLSTTYVGIVLSAMGTDYYPRLAGVADDSASCNRLINEQTEMGVLIAFPGVLATLVLAPWMLEIVYSRAFLPATEVIRWQILGDVVKVLSFPLTYITLAKGRGGLFAATNALMAALGLVLLYACVAWRQFEGVGIAALLGELVTLGSIFLIARSLTGFAWSAACLKTLLGVVVATSGVFLLCRYCSPAVSMSAGLAATALAGIWSLKKLQELTGRNLVAGFYDKLAVAFRGNREGDVQ